MNAWTLPLKPDTKEVLRDESTTHVITSEWVAWGAQLLRPKTHIMLGREHLIVTAIEVSPQQLGNYHMGFWVQLSRSERVCFASYLRRGNFELPTPLWFGGCERGCFTIDDIDPEHGAQFWITGYYRGGSSTGPALTPTRPQ